MNSNRKSTNCKGEVPEQIDAFFLRLEEQDEWDSEAASEVTGICRGCQKKGMCRDAIEQVSMHLRRSPERYEGWALLGELREQIGEREEAIGALRQGFVLAAEEEKWEEAAGLYERMERCDGGAALTVVSGAELQVARGQCKEAVDALMEEADRMLEEGKRQEFLVLGRSILSMDGDCEEIRKAMGEALVAEAKAFVNYGLELQALEALCDAVAYRPEQLEIYASMAKVMIGSADLKDAITVIEGRAESSEETRRREVLGRFADRLAEYVEAANGEQEKTVVVDESRRSGGGWPVVNEEMSVGVGQEETSPVFDTREVTRRIEEWEGPVVNGDSWVANAVDLLGLVDRLKDLSRVTLWDEKTEEIRGSFFVENGRLAVGVQVDGEAFDGGARLEESERKKLQELWRCYGVRSGADEKPQGSPSVSERLVVEVANAAAIERWSKLARKTRLGTSVKVLKDRKGPGLANRPRSLLLRMGRWRVAEGREGAFEMGRSLATVKRWAGRLIRVEEEGWLVWKYEGESSPTFEALADLSHCAREIGGQLEESFPKEELPRGWAWMGEKGAIGGIRKGDRMVIVETSGRGIGALLKLMQTHESKWDNEQG